MTLTVCCFLWTDPARQRSYTFGRDDVKLWNDMIEKNLTIPHRRVCITHRPDLVEDFIETIPIDPAKHVPGLCTVKLMVRRPDMAEVLGNRILMMDIDCVATGNLNSLVERDEPSVFWRNPNFEIGGRRGYTQGSLQLFDAGSYSELWHDFDSNATPAMLNRRFGGGEQAWISERLNTAWPEPGWEWDVPVWTEEDGVYGAGRLFGGKADKGVQSELPENAKIVFFPGDRNPSQPEVRQAHPWIERYL
jgi:hypothetical protein